ncbi:hypothetical protein P7H20_25695 [Paenibacillus larvae]|nr:hypothetical protein [Paenibacillus larvae]MDT2277559.1 hypothetical protein [Paenibacillus larvae]
MKIKYRLSIRYPGACQERSEIEIDDKELEGLTPEAEGRICEIVEEYVQDFISLSWEEVEE